MKTVWLEAPMLAQYDEVWHVVDLYYPQGCSEMLCGESFAANVTSQLPQKSGCVKCLPVYAKRKRMLDAQGKR